MSDETFLKSLYKLRLVDPHLNHVELALKNVPLHEKIQFFYNYNLSNGLWPNLNSEPVKSTDKALQYKNLGNEAFGSGSNIQALQFYTKSAAAALPGSQELAIAFANRSAALYRLERYKACLVDINRALASNYPDKLKPKLVARKSVCVSKLKVFYAKKTNYWKTYKEWNPHDGTLQKYLEYQMKECEFDIDAVDLDYKDKFFLPSVNFKNKKIPNVSEKLKIRFSEDMGRHVVATEDIKPGEVLAIEEPFVSILLFKHCHSHCSNCYVRCESLIPCTSCSTVMFCSQRCRDDAMNRFHRTECSILVNAFNSTKIQEKDWLAIRLLLIATKQGEELETLMQHPVYKTPFENVFSQVPEKFDSKDFANMFNMVHHLDKRPAGARSWHEKLEMAVSLLYILKSSSFFGTHAKNNANSKLTEKELYVGNLLLRFLLSLPYNNFVIDQTSGTHEEEHPFESGSHPEKVGYGVYSFNNLFNHGCENNVINHFHKDTNISYAIKTIKAGEQLFINYGIYFGRNNRLERQMWCREYHFTCHCQACELNWPTDAEELNISPELMQQHFRLRALCTNLRIPLSGFPHSAVILQFFCDILSSMDKEKVKQPNKNYMFWQRRIVLFVSARANYYESTRDHVLLSL